MKSVGDQILVRMDKELEDEHKIEGTDITLSIVADIDTNQNTRQFGWVYATNEHMESLGLKEGRKVWFHHFIAAQQALSSSYESNRISQFKEDNVYQVNVGTRNEYDRLLFAYEKEDGELKPILNFVFCKPIKKKKLSSIIETFEKNEYDEEYAEVYAVSDEAKELGLNKGDKVRFEKNADYPIHINGELLFKMNTDEIMYIEL